MKKMVVPRVLIYDFLTFLKLESKKIIVKDDFFFLEIYGKERYEIERFLNIGIPIKKTLISNKSKGIIIKFIYFEKYWRVEIYQKNSRSCIFVIDFDLKELGEYYYIFSSFENSFKLKKLEEKYNNLLANQEFFSKILKIGENDLKIFLQRDSLTSFEKKQVLFSYQEDILYRYDFYPERIENQKQYESAIEENKELETLKALYNKVAKKHNIILKRSEIGKY